MVEKELKKKGLEHSMSLETQGRLFRAVDTHASTIWSRAIQALNMKFALNAANDTLPHIANLTR